MDSKLINRYYDIASDFNDSISLIAILLIINKKSELSFPELKEYLGNLELGLKIVEDIEDIALSIQSSEMGRLIRLLSPIDLLFVREKPRDIPSIITKGRENIKKRLIKIVKCPKTKKNQFGLFGENN